MLERIQVQGFKSIREMDLELRPINILIGANGSGKSNLLGVFEMLNHMIENRLAFYIAKKGGAERFLYYGSKSTQNIKVRLEFDINLYKFDLTYATGGLIFEEESIALHKKDEYPNPLWFHLGRGHAETKLHEEAKQGEARFIAYHVLNKAHTWRIYHFHDTSDLAKVKQASELSDGQHLSADAGNLAAFLFGLKEYSPQYYESITGSIRQIAPFFEDFVLEPDILNPRFISLRWKDRTASETFDAFYLSDGTLRFICLATLLLQPNLPSLIVIDEPELGLHPSAIHHIAALIDMAAKRTQVILSTQSSMLVDYFNPEDIIVVDRKEGQSVFTRLSTQNLKLWLEDYSLGELWEKNVFGGKPNHE